MHTIVLLVFYTFVLLFAWIGLYISAAITKALHIDTFITRAIGFVISIVALFIIYLTLVQNGDVFFSNALAAFATIIMFYSLSLFLFRQVFIKFSQRFGLVREQIRLFLAFLRKHHILFGWLVFISVIAHGLYFIPYVHSPYLQIRLITGIIAFTALSALTLLGLYMQWRKMHGNFSHNTRLVHTVIGFLFAFLVAIHIILR